MLFKKWLVLVRFSLNLKRGTNLLFIHTSNQNQMITGI